MNKLSRIAVLTELENYIRVKYKKMEKEVYFNTLFDTKRKFRADYLIRSEKIIIEINGGQYVSGRHNRGGKGYETDLLKINLAQLHGYKVYQFTYEMLLRCEYKSLF